MPVLKKKDFRNTRIVYESVEDTIDELVDPDGSFIDSAVPDGDEDNIMTGPVETPAKERGMTDYKKGISPTTDKVRSNTSQGDRWQRAFAGLGGSAYSAGARVGSWIGWLHEDVLDEDIVKDKTDNKEMVDKVSDKDLTDNKAFMDILDKIDKMSDKEKEELHKLLSDAKS